MSLSTALALADLLPLDLQLEEAALLYEAKIRRPIECDWCDRMIEEKVCYLKATHPADQIEMQYKCIENTEQEIEHGVNDELAIFTDGSKIEGKVRASISVWKEDREVNQNKFKLELLCIVYQAE